MRLITIKDYSVIGKEKMNKKELATYGFVLVAIQCLVSCGLFVTYPQMAAYAVSKDNMQLVIERLNVIDHKLDTLMGYK